ncbi:uncharacterized protein LOC107983663 isoform X2 [Anolis carolinensis]|uniref:uncharacterized protein LOC107983663 isoform X2 n=1 Tax=Anolis carolinensis TaxID=28377 RepID=UPI0007DB7B7E|nr:PREDICTED: uncharacterized protein LOC107983663 isoform X1 [Anolis carolinensis]|eukprot:XP_016853631.1 PREDICTED: uncharacterized protein LOC107983663 isoform X1 [Anolis carolinensis]
MWALSSGCGTSWLSLFLAAQILISCFFVAHSQDTKIVNISVVLLPEFSMVGDSVTIIPETTERDVTSCMWFRSFEGKYYPIIFKQFKPDERVMRGDGYDGRQFLRENCALRITELDIADMAIYMIIRNTTSKTEAGKVFLRILRDSKVVTPSPVPHKLEPKVITVGTMAGIIVGCLIGSVLIVGLITYQTMKQSERNNLGSGEGRSPHSSSKPGSQQRLSIHNLGPVPAPQ